MLQTGPRKPAHDEIYEYHLPRDPIPSDYWNHLRWHSNDSNNIEYNGTTIRNNSKNMNDPCLCLAMREITLCDAIIKWVVYIFRINKFINPFSDLNMMTPIEILLFRLCGASCEDLNNWAKNVFSKYVSHSTNEVSSCLAWCRCYVVTSLKVFLTTPLEISRG